MAGVGAPLGTRLPLSGELSGPSQGSLAERGPCFGEVGPHGMPGSMGLPCLLCHLVQLFCHGKTQYSLGGVVGKGSRFPPGQIFKVKTRALFASFCAK